MNRHKSLKGMQCGKELEPSVARHGFKICSLLRHVHHSCLVLPCSGREPLTAPWSAPLLYRVLLCLVRFWGCLLQWGAFIEEGIAVFCFGVLENIPIPKGPRAPSICTSFLIPYVTRLFSELVYSSGLRYRKPVCPCS